MEDKNMENNYYVVENYNYANGNIGTVEYNYLNKANATSLIKIHYEQEIDNLKDNGYEIIEYNCRCKQGEIDIIAKDNETLVFVEVKTRKSYDDILSP